MDNVIALNIYQLIISIIVYNILKSGNVLLIIKCNVFEISESLLFKATLSFLYGFLSVLIAFALITFMIADK